MKSTEHRQAVIMLVEDSREVRQLIANLLAEYSILPFADGQSALEHLGRHPQQHIDLVISDYDMPGIKGVELLNEIRHIIPSVRTILMSGSIVDSLEEIAQRCRFDAYLPKPFPVKELLALVKKTLSKPSRGASECDANHARSRFNGSSDPA